MVSETGRPSVGPFGEIMASTRKDIIVRIKITKGGIFGANGEISVGTEIDVKEEPKGWAGRYEVISGGGKGKTAVTNPAKAEDGLKAVHNGGGRYVVKDGDDIVLTGMSKEDAGAFNDLSDEDKTAYVEASKQG